MRGNGDLAQGGILSVNSTHRKTPISAYCPSIFCWSHTSSQVAGYLIAINYPLVCQYRWPYHSRSNPRRAAAHTIEPGSADREFPNEGDGRLSLKLSEKLPIEVSRPSKKAAAHTTRLTFFQLPPDGGPQLSRETFQLY